MSCRAALCLLPLLLLSAGVAHLTLASPPWTQDNTQQVPQWLEQRLASWRDNLTAWLAPLAAAAGLPGAQPAVADSDAVGGGPREPEHTMLRVTLHLPNHQTLEVGEDSTPEELVQKLLAQGADQLPTDIEVTSVQRITRQHVSTWRTAWRAAASSAAARLSRYQQQYQHPAPTRRRPSSRTDKDSVDAAATSQTGGSSSSQVQPGSDATLAAHREDTPGATNNMLPVLPIDDGTVEDVRRVFDDLVLPVSAFDDSALDEAEGSAEQQQLAATAPGLVVEAASGVEAHAEAAAAGHGAGGDGGDNSSDGGSGGVLVDAQPMVQAVAAAAEVEAARRNLKHHMHITEAAASRPDPRWQPQSVKLFGPLLTGDQQQQREGQWDAGSELPAGEQSLPDAAVAAEGEELPPAMVVVIVQVVAQNAPQHPPFQLRLPHQQASLLEQLALGQSAAGQAGAALLGRKAAAGDGLAGFLAAQQQQQQVAAAEQQAELPAMQPASAKLLVVIDAVFAASCLVALACAVLLAVDVVRHGWRQPGGKGQAAGASWQPCTCANHAQQQPCPHRVVVAADEVAAAAGMLPADSKAAGSGQFMAQ